ncbi:MAG TPA: cytochrome P450 [Acidimicrobiales bacterium]|nr:cytochrome P450 [Acidimicrobiales bacterium]
MLTLGPVGRQGVPEITGRLVESSDWHDPWPIYRAARESAPILSVPEWDELLCLRYADCERVLRDATFSSNVAHRRLEHPDTSFDLDLPAVLLFMDPPDHTRLRRLVSHAFTPRTVERLRPHVAELADGMLAEADPAGFDLIEAIAYPLPVTVICELLGVPAADRHLFGPWSSDTSRLLDGDLTQDELNRGLLAALQLIQYLNALFEERRAAPRDDLVSALLAVEEEGDRLSEAELGAIVLLLFVAGHETTMNLIGNGTVALLRSRPQWERLVADPELTPNAVEELLRFDGPVHATQRIATEDAVVGEVQVEQGQSVICHLAAANRDPARFTDPDELDIARPDVQQLTFSHGIHYCLGAALARLEGQEAFKALTRRFPGLELAQEPVHRDHFVLRGYRAVALKA